MPGLLSEFFLRGSRLAWPFCFEQSSNGNFMCSPDSSLFFTVNVSKLYNFLQRKL